MQTRRDFLKTGMLSTAGLALAGMGVPIRSFARTLGANDRIRVGVIGFSDRFRSSLLPTFMANAKELKISVKSPIAQALMNHKVGEVVNVSVPVGIIRLRIETIERG